MFKDSYIYYTQGFHIFMHMLNYNSYIISNVETIDALVQSITAKMKIIYYCMTILNTYTSGVLFVSAVVSYHNKFITLASAEAPFMPFIWFF